MDKNTARALLESAKAAAAGSYSPYSKFAVGSAVEVEGGRVFTGANVESAAYGDTICAEKVAIAKAVTEGERRISAIALAGGADLTPCGSCRQLINEFNPDCLVITAGAEGEPVIAKAREMLPRAFGSKDLTDGRR